MEKIKIFDKEFTLSISKDEIDKQVARVAEEINRDYKGRKPILLGILNGCFIFASDLMRHLQFDCEISFIKLASYQGTASTGVIKEIFGLSESVQGRDVLIVEDIVDTGLTMQRILESLGTREPKSIAIASLFVKPSRLEVPIEVNYCAFSIPDRFIVGYGLDYDGIGRNLPDIYEVTE